MTSMQLSSPVEIKKSFGLWQQGRFGFANGGSPSLSRLFRRLGQILPEEEAQFRDGVRKLVGERIVVDIRIPFDGASNLVRQHLGAFWREDVVVLRVDHGELLVFHQNLAWSLLCNATKLLI